MKAEAQVINAICKNKDISSVLSESIDGLFDAYEDVWQGLLAYWHRYGSVPDIDILQEKFRDLEVVEISGATKFYVDELREQKLNQALRNVFTKHARNLTERGAQDVLNGVISDLTMLSREAGVVRDLDITDVQDAVETYKQRKELADRLGGSVGIPTGIKPFDRDYPTGLAGGHLIVVIGWSGFGKSWFTSYLACRAWEKGFKPMIVSLEMSPEQVRDRIYTMLGSGMFSNRNFSKGEVNVDTFESWSSKKFDDKQGFIIVSNGGSGDVTVNTVQAKVDQYRPDLVICDYHQLFGDAAGGNSEVLRNRNISRDLKLLAVRNDIPVIDITQATQSDKSDLDEPPLISQVAWSKGIQHDADLAISVHKDQHADVMEVMASKNRHGPLFGFFLELDLDRGIWNVTYGDDE